MPCGKRERMGAMANTDARVSFADLTPPIALGALDGRYRGAVAPLVDHLSEGALNRERIHVEVEWLIALTDGQVVPGAPSLTDAEKAYLRKIVTDFGGEGIAELGEIERVTVHDVKAVEYYIKRRIASAPEVLGADTNLPAVSELVHFCCTSEDINNLSYSLMVKGAVQQVWLPAATALVEQIKGMAREHKAVPMLSRTHGQPATPSTIGKELAVLAHRLDRQLRRIAGAEYLGKLNGATGTFGAHVAAVPGANWPVISRSFVEGLGLTWNPLTTQIESHDWQAEVYADVARFSDSSSRSQSKAPPVPPPCLTRSTQSALRTLKRTSKSRTLCSTFWARPWCSHACNATSLTRPASATSEPRSATRCSRSTT